MGQLAGAAATSGKTEKYELDDPLVPFDDADFNKNEKTLRHNKGPDVVDYQSSLCYEYEDLIFDGKTPAQFLEDMDAMDAALDKGYVNEKGSGYKG